MVKFCPHTDHTHSYGDSNYANSITGFDQVIERIREAKPNVNYYIYIYMNLQT